jgi:hypothetical protein
LLEALPLPDEAKAIRKAVGIRKKTPNEGAASWVLEAARDLLENRRLYEARAAKAEGGVTSVPTKFTGAETRLEMALASGGRSTRSAMVT